MELYWLIAIGAASLVLLVKFTLDISRVKRHQTILMHNEMELLKMFQATSTILSKIGQALPECGLDDMGLPKMIAVDMPSGGVRGGEE